MHSTILTSYMAMAGAVSGAAVNRRQVSELPCRDQKAGGGISGCSSNATADFDFNIGYGTLGACVPLPFSVATLEIGALRDGPYQGEFKLLPTTHSINSLSVD